MLFNSLEFFLFLPIVFCLYWFVFQKNLKAQNLFVVVVSYIFYGWWNWRFLLLIAFTSLCSYASALWIERCKQKVAKKGGDRAKLWCVANVVLNLAILGVYKYYDFFIGSLVSAFNSVGITLHAKSLGLILPVGISFYTFQALSYTIDVYRGKLNATKDIVSFFAFISFFPQLVAGPIERATNLLPQFYCKRYFDYSKAIDGCRLILWGLFKKMVIADRCALEANEIFSNYTEFSSITLVLGALYFTFQIYGDFSGYSDIAIGVGRLFGIEMRKNFDIPYFSRNIAEFWKRWHISLNTWFVDYVYIPLGGSREGLSKTIRNTLVIFLLSGLWHGANWTFIVWGLYHAILFVPLLLLGKSKVSKDQTEKISIKQGGQMLTTFVLVVLGWIIFRAENIQDAYNYVVSLFINDNKGVTNLNLVTWLMITVMMTIEWFSKKQLHPMRIFENRFMFNSKILRWCCYAILILIIATFSGQQATFIYFQF